MKKAPFRRTLITLLTVAFAALALPATASAKQPSFNRARPAPAQVGSLAKPKLRFPKQRPVAKHYPRVPATKASPRVPRLPAPMMIPPQMRIPARFPLPTHVKLPQLKLPTWPAPNAKPPVIPAKLPNLLPNMMPQGWSR